jgi:hypothetical protein
MPFDLDGVVDLSIIILQRDINTVKTTSSTQFVVEGNSQPAAVIYRESLVIPSGEETVSPQYSASS